MIEVTGVNKMFGEIKALDNIVATIQEGSIFGLIGTNGAGKSTLLRVISGVLKPDTGMAPVSYTHLDVYKRQVPLKRPPGKPGAFGNVQTNCIVKHGA